MYNNNFNGETENELNSTTKENINNTLLNTLGIKL